MGFRPLFWAACVALYGSLLCLPCHASQGSLGIPLRSQCRSGSCNPAQQRAEVRHSKPKQSKDQGPVSLKKAFRNLPGDQKAIWTSPFHVHERDLYWVVPFAATTGLLIGSDRHSMARARSNADAIDLSKNISDAGVAGIAGVPVTMYFWGVFTGAPRARETGLLSGEAMFDSLGVNEALKLVFARERPGLVAGKANFFQTVTNASFPSLHSTLSWTAASVIAHEYPSFLTQTLLYGTAASVSVSRVTGREHFPSDVVVGSALGWLIGKQVYKAHHDPDIDGALYGSFRREHKEQVDPEDLGSIFVPLDSWVYSALKRLAARGYINTQFTGLEPWTRAECRRQLEEAAYYAQDLDPNSDVAKIIQALREEFSDEPHQYYTAQLDSFYTRYTQISGIPLRDGYHFGQTLWNDFGRPYDQGTNIVSGATASAVAGPFFFYAQGEYQHAPGRGALTDAQRTFIAHIDENPVSPATPVDTIDRFYPIDMYAGVKLGAYSLAFGKQSLWLSPSAAPLMVSNNADPMYTLDFSRTSPLVLPGFLHWLGSMNGEFLFSKLSGHQFAARPFFNLQKISFHPTENLEIGFTRASIWAGVGHPFTAHSLSRNLFDLSDSLPGFGDRNDPGDRKSGFDFSYRIPGLRKWLTVYSDMYSDDDPSPLANLRRTAVSPGFYVSHLPGLTKLDLRGEATSTQSLTETDRGPDFFYFNVQYHDANTNKGLLFGNTTGRDGRSYQGSSTYHFSAATKLMLTFRQLKVSNVFLPGGGTQTDARAQFQWQIHHGMMLDALIQHERYLIPIVSPNAQQNFTGQLQLIYTPHWRVSAN
jgi:capsule assembly protein Wzi/PAP2 superfamily protein